VIDRMVSLGNEGALYTEIRSILQNKIVSGFIAGLGGRDIRQEHIEKAFLDIMKDIEIKEEWLF
ncbi:MAG: pyruvate ferredoxin oxidoreductase, partial [Candidatus Woesearchaeota archaeon]|nr:pyruvate ferredoxin oxidoreductase [Candidatus Woesearchaeota archaeon]